MKFTIVVPPGREGIVTYRFFDYERGETSYSLLTGVVIAKLSSISGKLKKITYKINIRACFRRIIDRG